MELSFSQDWLCRRLVAGSRDAIIFADQNGLIRLWNTGAEVIIRDVTARWQRDQEIKKRLAALESI